MSFRMLIEILFLISFTRKVVNGQYGGLSERSDKSCLSVWPGLIIRTTESIANGAEFINRVDVLSSAVIYNRDSHAHF